MVYQRTHTWLYSLKDSLQPLKPHLTPLVCPQAIEQLDSVSSYFPDAIASTYGFEYRLQPSAPVVDFAFQITDTGRDILAGLNPHTRLSEDFNKHPVWQQIQKFSTEWADPSSLLHYFISDLWLEFDLKLDGDTSSSPSSLGGVKGKGERGKVLNPLPFTPSPSPDPAFLGCQTTNIPIPGLFFGVTSPPDNSGISFNYSWIWEQAMPLLLGTPLPPALEKKFIDCIKRLPPRTSIFQVGLMFSRTVEAIRLCLVGSPSELLPYLNEIGWTGQLAEVEKLVNSLSGCVDGIILDLDIGEQIYPRIGIEGIFLTRYQACVNGQWESLLDYLTSQGLCAKETKDALLKYSGYSLVKHLGDRIYVRGLNHIKLIYQSGQPLASKIYFGAMHQPLSKIPGRSAETVSTEDATKQERGDGGRVSHIESAVTFLLTARNSEGWWIDFHLAAGLSDEWVTGYVGTMLANIPDSRVSKAVSTAWNLLNSRRHRVNGKWGYNRLPPGDADSTGWVLQLARAIGESNSERARQAMQSLADHKRPDGGICTYESEESIRAFIHASPEIGFAGWCGSHTCVSAAIAALPEYRFQLQDYLRSTQQNDGSWLAYWWQDPEYVTALAAEAIAACYPNSDCITNAVAWGMNRLSSQGFVATSDCPSGSPFATAWCLRLLILRRQDTAVQAAIAKATDWLLAQQQPNGSWISSARLQVPLPDDLNPNKFNQWIYHGTIQGSVVFDKYCVFTTATVLQALHRSL
ncbi:prenyltransferase/squalene oxidase repeat-containing protein [Nostoc linckia]|uniref:prenyltransferase/squalene oxidase repeat-containing protein n=1 Tax=Nostoc linckia TaxID=92942 RepID=UPI000BFFCBBC|nr:prenyltransferase/squalene oxidase repeat-containing protein [Nostoc linckia]